jgi:nucleotidyltransferase/DNA polymerase involved in DNA repair
MTYCPNAACPARIYWGIVHFVSRAAMDIRGLGERTTQQLIDAGLVSDVGDLYSLTVAQLLSLEGFQRKSAENLVAGIEESKARGFARVLHGLGVRHVGETAAQLLAQSFGSMERLFRHRGGDRRGPRHRSDHREALARLRRRAAQPRDRPQARRGGRGSHGGGAAGRGGPLHRGRPSSSPARCRPSRGSRRRS